MARKVTATPAFSGASPRFPLYTSAQAVCEVPQVSKFRSGMNSPGPNRVQTRRTVLTGQLSGSTRGPVSLRRKMV